MSTRLSEAQLRSLPSHVLPPQYDRAAQRIGIVHLGLGAFHRAHQAMYTDAAMAAGDRHWSIVGISMRSSDVRDALEPQQGLYTLVVRDNEHERAQVIGAIQKVLVAPEDSEAVVAMLASPDVHVVTLTVTEKGYHRDSTTGSLLVQSPDVAIDLTGGSPRTIYGYLEQAFLRRRATGLPGLSLMSCDNLPHNGQVLAGLLNEFLERRDPTLAAWVRATTRCPSSMVDRIVPAPTIADLQNMQASLGIEDRGAVFTEAFSQWVIEDNFAGPRPRWEVAGAQISRDVRAFETAKLRMLNGAHSALAYIGLALGMKYVHEAIADTELRTLVWRVMRDEAPASFTPAPEQDIDAYAKTLVQRFGNSALNHRLVQIAMDGTQKIPQRWFASITGLLARGEGASSLVFALAAWIDFVMTPERSLDDPLAAALCDIRTQARGDTRFMVDALVGDRGLLSNVRSQTLAPIAELLHSHLNSIRNKGMHIALREHLATR